jgi:putative ABC transport system permease protein
VAIGFGVFLLATLAVVQRNLLGWLELDDPTARANLVAFDILPDQRADVEAAFSEHGAEAPLFVPIVTARLDAINDSAVTEIARDAGRQAQSWAMRREYRNTYRAEVTETERLLEGEWWDAPREEGSLPRISMELDVANDLRVGIGDRITWNVQGIRIETRIASLRSVEWARFDTNFFVVFEPGVLEDAPQSFVTVARVPDATARAQVQRQIVLRHPNISMIDLATIQATLERIVGRVALAVRLMAGVGLVAAAFVLFGAIAAARFQRARESALLRTLGATRGEIRQILFTEYVALGSLGAFIGVVLGAVAGWLVTTRSFDLPFRLPVLELILIWAGVAAFAALLGTANSRDALRDTPLAALRMAAE